MANVRRPANPRDRAQWEAGNWPGAPADKVKYQYCRSGPEDLSGIATRLSGQQTGDQNHPSYQTGMTQDTITDLNYGTHVIEEVNWYLQEFNGCTNVGPFGQNYILDARDTRPWVWIPTTVAVPPTVITLRRSPARRINLPPPHNEFSQAVANRFRDIDRDGDRFLSRAEIDRALGSTAFRGNDAAAVATLKKHLGDFEELHDDEWLDENDGVTRSDMTAYDRLRIRRPGSEVIRRVQGMYDYGKQKIANASRQLFVGAVDPLSVAQGELGDCWFLAAIVGLGLIPGRGDAAIRGMITPRSVTPQPSGNQYSVRFPGVDGAIGVSEPTDGEIAMFSGAGANGLWLSVLEKAYGAAVNRDAYFFVETSHYDAAGNAISFVEDGIEVMTGSSVHVHRINSELDPLERGLVSRRLQDAFRSRKVVTAGIRRGILGDYRDSGLPMGHAYTVVAFDPATNIIALRNPWGRGGAQWPANWPIGAGVFQMSLERFMSDFSEVAFEQ